MMAKLPLILLLIALACVVSGAMFPPGDVPRQLTLVILWFLGRGGGIPYLELVMLRYLYIRRSVRHAEGVAVGLKIGDLLF